MVGEIGWSLFLYDGIYRKSLGTSKGLRERRVDLSIVK